MKIVGIVLIVVGVIALAWGGISYTTREKVVDLGPIEASKESEHTIPLPPLAGVASLVAGIALVAMGRRSAH
jgi:hypothetical protein